MLRCGLAHIAKGTERANRSSDQDFVAGGLARLARDFYAAMVEFGYAVFQTESRQFIAVGAKGIRFDDVRARLQIGHVHAKHFLGARGVEFVDAALRTQRFIQQGAHGPVRYQYGVAQSLLEFFDSHGLEKSPKTVNGSIPEYFRFACEDGIRPTGGVLSGL